MKELKQDLRNQLRKQRRLLSHDEQQQFAELISNKLFQLDFFKKAHHIGLYLPFDGEVSTLPILKLAMTHHKACYVPQLAHQRLEFFKIDLQTNMIKNRFGILEPSYPFMTKFPLNSLDVVLVPLVGFDKQCNRLGMGKGFYDATFALRRRGNKPRLIGLAYDFQRVSSLPRSKLDLPLDGVVTQREFYYYKF